MTQKKATGLNWYGGPSGSSVWLGLGRLLLPAEFERAEVIRRSRRARTRAQKTQEDAASGTVAAGDTEGDNGVGEAALDSEEQEPQNGPENPEEGDDTGLPDGEDTPTDVPADNTNESSGDAIETLAPDHDDNNNNNQQGGSPVADDKASNTRSPDTASGEAQPRPMVTGGIRGGGWQAQRPRSRLSPTKTETQLIRFSRATTVVETPLLPSESQARESSYVPDRDRD
ncbi:hypothetical protein LTR84_003143 [Exophiala bonariae]|uniref:Uncharacterized protein n=1 Tax=Exophiala bonariae TaxID=1690606 RepID=A0AAV9N800_9EURO|nr:hypothetical protein LTR84_003143 [Exophiala bonariae]